MEHSCLSQLTIIFLERYLQKLNKLTVVNTLCPHPTYYCTCVSIHCTHPLSIYQHLSHFFHKLTCTSLTHLLILTYMYLPPSPPPPPSLSLTPFQLRILTLIYKPIWPSLHSRASCPLQPQTSHRLAHSLSEPLRNLQPVCHCLCTFL